MTYYVDGAHTPRSMKACQKWFETSAEQEASKIDGPVARILIFNSTGDRDETPLIEPLIVSLFVLYINAYVRNSHIKRQGSERPIKGSQLLKNYIQLKKKQSLNDNKCMICKIKQDEVCPTMACPMMNETWQETFVIKN